MCWPRRLGFLVEGFSVTYDACFLINQTDIITSNTLCADAIVSVRSDIRCVKDKDLPCVAATRE